MLVDYSHSLRRKLSAFTRDRSGGVIMIFAVASMLLVLVAAGAIELHRRNLALVQLQNAADVAALAGKKRQIMSRLTMTLAQSQAAGSAAAKQMFEEMLKKSKYFNTLPVFNDTWNADGSYAINSAPKYNVMFGTVLPPQFAQLSVKTTVDMRNNVPTEVALLLDTTTSMFNTDGRPETRFTLMRNAAKSFTHQVFNAAQATGDVNALRVSVVPWATTVNILGGAPAAADFTGDAKVVSMPDRGSQIPVASPIGRGGVANSGGGQFKPVEWRGCVTGETESVGFDDSKPANFNALRAQAAPPVNVTLYEGPLKSTPVTTCTCTASENVPCGPGGGGGQGFHRLIEQAIPQIRSAAFLFDKRVDAQGAAQLAQCSNCTATSCSTSNQTLPDCSTPTKTKTLPYCYFWGDGGRRNSFLDKDINCTDYYGGCFAPGTMPVEQKASACVADPNEPDVISGKVPWCPAFYQPASKSWDQLVNGFAPEIAGPNLNCPSPILGLSGNRKQIIEYLDRMTPVPGGTHADVGLRWGLRTLAPTNQWPKFFGLTKDPGAWGDASKKIMVLITDGVNEQAQHLPGYWGCNVIDADHPDCTGSPDSAALDASMQGWCDAIRTKYKIKLFAIAVNFKDAAAVTRLQSCVADPANVYSVDAADLNRVLDGIASQVMSLRLTQ